MDRGCPPETTPYIVIQIQLAITNISELICGFIKPIVIHLLRYLIKITPSLKTATSQAWLQDQKSSLMASGNFVQQHISPAAVQNRVLRGIMFKQMDNHT